MKCSFLSGKPMRYSRPKNKTYATHSFDILNYGKGRRPHFYPLYPISPKHEIPDDKQLGVKGSGTIIQSKKIAEAIILQAIEDLWIPVHKKESMGFFAGEGFVICAKLVGMGLYEKLRLIQVIKKAIQKKVINTRDNF